MEPRDWGIAETEFPFFLRVFAAHPSVAATRWPF